MPASSAPAAQSSSTACPASFVAWRRVSPFYSRLMTRRLQRHFLHRNAAQLAHLPTWPRMLAARDLDAFHAQVHELAGHATQDDYLDRTNPVPVFDTVAVPLLIVNADDDPVCVAQNARDHVDAVRRLPGVLLVRTARGSHCAFPEGWAARSWAHRLMADYLGAVDG